MPKVLTNANQAVLTYLKMKNYSKGGDNFFVYCFFFSLLFHQWWFEEAETEDEKMSLLLKGIRSVKAAESLCQQVHVWSVSVSKNSTLPVMNEMFKC